MRDGENIDNIIKFAVEDEVRISLEPIETVRPVIVRGHRRPFGNRVIGGAEFAQEPLGRFLALGGIPVVGLGRFPNSFRAE